MICGSIATSNGEYKQSPLLVGVIALWYTVLAVDPLDVAHLFCFARVVSAGAICVCDLVLFALLALAEPFVYCHG